MKKTKRILAIAGVVLLVGMYIATLILALLDSTETMMFFRASVGCTILIPILLFAYTMAYKWFNPKDKEDKS